MSDDFLDVDLSAVDTTERLLDDVRAFVARYIVMGDEQLDTIALWILHTYTFESWDVTPYLAIVSPTIRSGKTNLLLILEALCARSELSPNVSPASLYRLVDLTRPTLLLDEGDQRGMSRDQVGILNSGYKAGAYVIRMYKGLPERLSTFCPKAFASIGVTLPRTLVDRSIQVHMRRKLPHEHVLPFRHGTVRVGASTLVDRLIRFGELCYHVRDDSGPDFPEPDMPPGLSDRQQELWLPLLTIAWVATVKSPDTTWLKRAEAACEALTVEASQDEPDDAVEFLHDIRQAFGSYERMSSDDLLNTFRLLPEPCYNGLAITSKKGLAERLKLFRIFPQQLRFRDQTLKGYRRSQFDDAFERYLR